MSFENYEDFCKAFSDNGSLKIRAELLLFLQDWIIRLSGDGGEYYSISELLERNADKSSWKDARNDCVSKIIFESDSAVRHIAAHMRENIIRENVKLPVYQVKEVNSYGLNWLSRRPGRTIKEKISNSTSLIAVKRRMSLDTGENRLYIAFLKEMNDILEMKAKYLPGSQMTKAEREFWDYVNSVLYNDELEEIGRWENMPPNNTLLSDQYYKKVWKGWEELKGLDQFIKDCNTRLSDRMCKVLYIEFLTRARSIARIPQVPSAVEYEDYEIAIMSSVFYLIDKDNNKLSITKDNENIRLGYKQKSVDVSFTDNVMNISSNDGNNSIELSFGRISRVVDLMFVKLGISVKGIIPQKGIEKKSFSSITVDLFNLYPGYINDNGDYARLEGRLALQRFGRYDLPCDDAKAIIVQNESMVPYTVQSAVIDNSLPQLGQLLHLLEEQVVTNNFTFVFPDAFDEFQLSLVHKAARMAYRKVKSFPRSIGIAFDYQQNIEAKLEFQRDDFLLVVDIVDDDVVFTLVQGLVSEEVKYDYPEYDGYVWERHPSFSYSIDSELNDLFDELKPTGLNRFIEKMFESFGLEGILSVSHKLSVIYDEDHWFSFAEQIYDSVQKFRINISEKVNRFLLDHHEMIGKSKVHVVSLSKHIFYKGTCSFDFADKERALVGAKIYEELQSRTASFLWRDHLPELAIKLLYGKFTLVDKETSTPKFNVKKKIAINSDFTLPANGKKEYRFNLVQSDSNKKTKFMAVVTSPAFPLSEDVPCVLDMSYEYGAENPYVLFFRPQNKTNTKFIEARVNWRKISEYPMYGLPYPEFMLEKSWDELRNFDGLHGKEDLIYGQRGLIDSFENIQAGYSTIDLSDINIFIKSGKNGRSFTIETEINEGDPIKVIFSEKNVERSREDRINVSFDHPGVVSFDLSEVKNTLKRYRVDLTNYADYYGHIWKSLNRGHACFITMDVPEIDPYNSITVALFENQFDHPEFFNEGISDVSFEIVPQPDGKYKAQKIHDENSDEPYHDVETYWASSIRKGDKPGFYTYGGRFYFLMHTIFTGTKSFYDDECPRDLQEMFENTLVSWNNAYYRCDDEYIRSRIFGLMSIVGHDMGAVYYAIAKENVDRYLSDERYFKLNDYIGYGLGDFTLPEEKDLFKEILKLPDEKIICILSKAVWGNPEFIWNFPIHITMKYFDLAIARLGELAGKSANRKASKDITMCIEYILAVYRLREKYSTSETVMKALSQNNRNVQRLYEYLERVIDMARDNIIEIKCLLNLEIADKGIYESIPNLLYALLVYITGNTEVGDIRIKGLSMEDLEV